MSPSDLEFSPRPSNSFFEFRNREAVNVVNGYIEEKKFWHVSYDFFLFHGHFGFAPINVFGNKKYPGGDPKFFWREAGVFKSMKKKLFVKWEFRPFGLGPW